MSLTCHSATRPETGAYLHRTMRACPDFLVFDAPASEGSFLDAATV